MLPKVLHSMRLWASSLKNLARDKLSSLFSTYLVEERKKFYEIVNSLHKKSAEGPNSFIS
jgi:hypothetical protein